MKALFIESPGNIQIREVDDPVIANDDDVLVKVALCGLCGTDLHIYRGLEAAKYPVIPGHEFCGVVDGTGANAAKTLKKGDRVVVDPNLSCFQCEPCRKGMINHCVNGMINQGVNLDGGFAEAARVSVKQCYKISEDLPDEIAVLGEPLSCVLHGIDEAGLSPSDKVVIFGGGPIGVLIYKCLRSIMGVKDTAIVEISEDRINAARKAGVESICPDPLQGEADVVFEASGSIRAFEKGFEMMNPGGRVIQFGVPNEDIAARVSLHDVYRKEIKIIGSFVNPFTMSRAVRLLSDHKNLFAGIVSAVLSPVEAADILCTGKFAPGFLKAVVKFQ